MKRKFRLIKSTDFMRVRRLGKSYAHPLVVLIKHPGEIEKKRIGISAGRSVGNAVHRNRVKRKIREIIRPVLPKTKTGWDIILLARKPITTGSHQEIRTAIYSLFKRADLLNENTFKDDPIG